MIGAAASQPKKYIPESSLLAIIDRRTLQVLARWLAAAVFFYGAGMIITATVWLTIYDAAVTMHWDFYHPLVFKGNQLNLVKNCVSIIMCESAARFYGLLARNFFGMKIIFWFSIIVGSLVWGSFFAATAPMVFDPRHFNIVLFLMAFALVPVDFIHEILFSCYFLLVPLGFSLRPCAAKLRQLLRP